MSEIVIQKAWSLAGPAAPAVVEKKEVKTQKSTPWKVVVFNDPVNLMEYVTQVFCSVFGYTREQSMKHMREVHELGKSVVWTGKREKAEFYVQQLHGAQLKASIEKA